MQQSVVVRLPYLEKNAMKLISSRCSACKHEIELEMSQKVKGPQKYQR